jgi:hypothetical protein
MENEFIEPNIRLENQDRTGGQIHSKIRALYLHILMHR